jgi:cell division initiation protein
MRLSYLDILEQCFHDKFRGYNKQEVDTFLRLIADDFKSMAEEIKDKDSEIKNLLSALKSQPAEKDTSIALEKAKKIVNAAKNQAEQHRKESMKELEQLIQDIEELKKQKSTLIKNIKSTATEHLNKMKAGLPNDHT